MRSLFVNVESSYTWRGTISKIIISYVQYFSMWEVLIFCVLNTLNDYIINGKNWRPYQNIVSYMPFKCTYNTTIDLIPKSSCFLIFLVWVIDTVCMFVIITSPLLDIFWLNFLMTLKCDVIGLWPSGVPGFWIHLKVSSLVFFFSLDLCDWDLSPTTI